MGWFKDILDEFGRMVHKIDDFFGGAWSGLAHTAGFRYFTKKGLELRYNTMSTEEKNDPKVKAAYDAAKKDIEEGGMFAGLPEALLKGFDGLKDTIQGSMADLLKTSLQPGSPEVTKAIEGVMDTLLVSFLNIMDPEGDKISEELRKKFTDTMSPMMNLGLTFTVGTVLAELIHPTKEMGMGRISHFIFDTVGFKALMDAYIDPIRTNLVKQPTKYAINELTTPFIPRWGDFVEWFGRGHVSEEQMEEAMAKHGISKSYSWLYARMGTKPSSYFMLNAIGKEGLYDEQDFKFWLSDAGYGAFQITKETMSEYEHKYGLAPPKTTQIDFLALAYKRMSERIQWSGMVPIAKKAVREGLKDISFFKEQLGRTYRKKEVDELEVELLEGEIKEEVDKEYRRAYEKKYLAGRMEKEELEKKLKEHGLRSGRVTARVQYLMERKLGKLAVEEDEKVLSDGRIINSYKYGLKPQVWAIKELDDKGYSFEDAELMVDAVVQKREEDANKEWIRVYEQRMKYGLLELEGLVSAYIEKGKDREWAEARAAYVFEKTVGAPEVISEVAAMKIKANITKEWIRVYEQRATYEEITEDELVSAYEELGKNPEWAKTRAALIFEKIEEKERRVVETEAERLKRLEEAEAERVKRLEETEAERIQAELVKQWIKVIEQRAAYGLITPGELEREYIEAGKNLEWARTRAALIFETIEEREKQLEEAEAERVERLGLAEAEKVKRLEETETERIKAELVREWIRVIEERATYGRITKEALIIEYTGLGKDPEWAKTRAALIFEEIEERAKRLEEAEAERAKRLEEAEAERVKAEIVKEWIRVIEQRAMHGLITQSEIEKEYIESGKDPEWAKNRATYIFEKIEKKEKRLEEAEAERVKRLGLAEAERLKRLEDVEAERVKAEIVKEWIRVIEQRAIYGLLTQTELEKEYIKSGKDPEWAKNRAIYIFEKIEKKEKGKEE
jgi:hypothetical protein